MSENGHKVIEIPASLTVRDLAARIEASPIDVIKQLMANGVMANINQQIDYDTAAIVIEEFGFEARPAAAPEAEQAEERTAAPEWRRIIGDEDPASLVPRPPVVTILGHVDHGKTTLLDAIRETNVAEGEAGGITQRIAAYQVRHRDRLITFLDTPGHAAFTAMRARGAQGADIAVLVVAADDGVMPQTKEALAHVKAARVRILVALNKVDKPNANPDNVRQQLADLGLIPDDWGGDTLVVPVSAKKRTGIEDLLEAILLVADTTEIKANPKGRVFGSVIEARLDRNKGVVATLLVQNGTLRVGDILLAGKASGNVRAMADFQGNAVQDATPSTPVSVLGLSDVPDAGEVFITAASEREARTLVAERRLAAQQAATRPRAAKTLEQVFDAFQKGETQELRLIVKADVQGSLEPIVSSLRDLSAGEIKVNVLHAATGNIGENDVMLAAASDAIVIGFNVMADPGARRMAEAEGVDIRLYDIIYRLTEDVEKALKGLLAPETRKVVLGRAEVRKVFRIPKLGNIAGSLVVQGEMRRGARARVLRGQDEIFDGTISSLKHEKEDEREMREGFECGIGVKGFSDFQAGDVVECYTTEQVAAE
ncbi:MAG TPA: translation initiation factor IF-2 [Anaerolineales bacterium]|nr:translation initiation factor IF-2 [Anaerolineales bacterium]